MGKIEKWLLLLLLPSNCRYFDKTFIETFPEKSCISHIFLAHFSFLLVAMETIVQKNGIRKYFKNYLLGKHMLHRNNHHISLFRYYVFFYENQFFSLDAMATWSFHTLIMGRIEKWHLLPTIAYILTKLLYSAAHKSRSIQISERFCLTSSLIPDCDCNSTSSVDIYFSSIIACSLNSICLFYCKNARRLKA